MARGRRIGALLTASLAVVLASPAAAACKRQPCTRIVYFGTHGNSIVAARLDERTGRLASLGPVANVERPTWLVAAPTGPYVYSVSEIGNDGASQARVHSFRADAATGALTPLNDVGSGGGGATHLALDAASATLFVANYGTGQVASLPVQADGRLGPAVSVLQDEGSGPSPRQKGPHAHGIAVAPGGRAILVTDLGADRIFIERVDPVTHMMRAGDSPALAVKSGSGPRHAAFVPHTNLVYVDSELTGEITGYRWNPATATLRPLATVSTSAPTYQGTRSAAELAASADGRFVYVSNRGEDTIVTYAVNAGTGDLREVQRVPSGGKTPWSFGIEPGGDWMLATNEGSSSVTVFRIDRRTGKLTATGEALAVEKPVSVAFLHRED